MDDLFLFLGCVSITIGVALIYIPAALIVGGFLMIGIGLLIGRKNAIASKSVPEQQHTEGR